MDEALFFMFSEASCHLRLIDPNSGSGAVLQQSAATEGVFCFLRSLLVRTQVYDLTAVQITGVLVRMRATGSVKNTCEEARTRDGHVKSEV